MKEDSKSKNDEKIEKFEKQIIVCVKKNSGKLEEVEAMKVDKKFKKIEIDDKTRKEKTTIAVVGLGVIGGSFAKALKNKGYKNVYGIDIDEKTLKRAKEEEVIVEGFIDAGRILPYSDLVIFSIYPEQIVDFLKENKEYFKSGAILADTTGIKEYILDEVEKNKPDGVDFIFAHPMAGREGMNYDFSSAEVFEGANFLIVDSEKNNQKSIDFIEEIVRDIGFERITHTNAKIHDKAISYTSQLSHVIAVSLINSEEKCYDTDRFTGDSYREITRIANINEKLWSQLFVNNKDNLIYSIDCFVKQVEKMREVLQSSDREELEEMFKEAKVRREKLFIC